MKKIVFGLLLLTGFGLSSKAQKGSILAYGFAGVHNQKQPDDDKTTNFSVYPGVGYQFANNWTAGVAGGFGHKKFEPAVGDESKSSTYQAGGFARYTQTINAIFSLYGQTDLYYQGTKVESVKSNGFGAAFIPYVGINVHNDFALNISFGGLSYETMKVKGPSDATKTFDMNFSKDIRIGFSKKFTRKK
jgi:hypothetical protein